MPEATICSGPIPVLFTHYGNESIRGSERVLLDLLSHLDPERVKPIVWCNAVAMADASRSAGFTTYQSEFHYYFDYTSPGFSIADYRSLVREGIGLVRKHDIRVLHANSAAPNQWLFPVSRMVRRPILVHLHADYLRRSRYSLLLHQAQLIIGVSRKVVENFYRDGMHEDKVQVIYNGIDFNRLESSPQENLRETIGIPKGSVVISIVGSLIPIKGQDLLIHALKNLGDRLISTKACPPHLLVVGDGPEREKLERLTETLGLRGRVHFLGHCDNPSMCYRSSDIVVLASRADAFPLVLLEAGFCGRPVIATSVGGIPEALEHGSTGLLVPPDDVESLATALSRLIEDRPYRHRLGAAAEDRIKKEFGIGKMAAKFERVYERLDQLPRNHLGWLSINKTIRPYLRLLNISKRSHR